MQRREIPKVLRKLRQESGLSLSEAARRAGLANKGHLSLLENGRRKDPAFSTMARLALLYGVPLETFQPDDWDDVKKVKRQAVNEQRWRLFVQNKQQAMQLTSPFVPRLAV